MERYAEQSMAKVTQAMAAPEETTKKTFLKLFHFINERNDEAARMFDEFRRSTALIALRMLRSKGFITDSEIQELSEETRELVERSF